MADGKVFKKAIQHFVGAADHPTNIAHAKLLRAKHTDKSVTFTLEEFNALREETARLILGTGINNESTNKLKEVWERGILYTTAPNPGMFYLKSDEVETWCEVLKEHSQAVIRSSSFNRNLMYWFTYQPETDDHPLNGQMDSSIDYESKVEYKYGMAQWDYDGSETLGEQKAKDHFFHILATIDKLEGFKHQRKGACLSYLDACAVMHFLNNTLRNLLETLPSSNKGNLGAIYAAGKKLSCAIQKEKGAKLTRDELLQVLAILRRISRPKPKSKKEMAEEPPAREYPIDLPHARDNNLYTGSNDHDIHQQIMRSLGHAPISGGVYTIADWLVVAQAAVDNLKVAKKKGGPYKLTWQTALKLFIAMSIMFGLATKGKYQADLDVTTLARLINLFHRHHTLALLGPDEVAYLDGVFGDMPAAMLAVARHGMVGPVFSIPPSMSPQEAMEFDIAEFRRELFNDSDSSDLMCKSGQQILLLPEHVDQLARIFQCAKYTRESVVLTGDQAWDIILTLRVMFQHKKSALVEPTSNANHPQVTAVNRLLGLAMNQTGTEKIELAEFDLREVNSLSEILDQLPAMNAIYKQDRLSVSTNHTENEQGSVKQTSHVPLLSLSTSFDFDFGNIYTGTIAEHLPNVSRVSCKNKKPLGYSKMYTEGDLDSIVAIVEWALKRSFTIYNRDPLLSQEEWEYSIEIPQVNQMARARRLLTLLCAKISMMARRHYDDMGLFIRGHKSDVEELKRQITDGKAEADAKFKEMEAKYNEADAKYNKLREDHGHAKEEAISQFKKSKADIEKLQAKAAEDEEMIRKLKEAGRGEIQHSRDRANRYKNKYDEEVKNSSIMKLDYEATLQNIEEMQAEKEKLVKTVEADRLRITNLESEIGGLRTLRAMSALDQRTAEELYQLHGEHAILWAMFETLKEENDAIKKENEEIKTTLATKEAIQETTKTELDMERTRPQESTADTAVLKTQVQNLQSQLAQKDHDLAELSKAAMVALEQAKGFNASLKVSQALCNSYTKEIMEVRRKNGELQTKMDRITAAMAALSAAVNP